MKVLQFGGGKDSLACLYLLREQWDDITVMWMNTGAAFPESLHLMRLIRQEVPHFIEVKADVEADIASHGYPVDVLPVNASALGRTWSGVQLRLRSYIDCCAANIWMPLQRATLALKPEAIIRGQHVAEAYKSTVRNGDVIDGIRYEFPIQEWTEREVFRFLRQRGIPIPQYYQYTGTSLDCWNCTAYLDAKLGQLKYMQEFHPDKHAIVQARLQQIHAVTVAQLRPLLQAVQT